MFIMFVYSLCCLHIPHILATIAYIYTTPYFTVLQVGRLLGKALMDGHVTPVHLVQPLYKHLMGWPISLRDIEQIDDQLYRYAVITSSLLSTFISISSLPCLLSIFMVFTLTYL